LRVWAGQYGLDLRSTVANFEGAPDADAVRSLLPAMNNPIPAPGQWPGSGLQVTISSRGGAELVDLPAEFSETGSGAVGAISLWDAMARVADRGLVPTWELVAADLAARRPAHDAGTLQGDLAQAWQRWAAAYPEAFSVAAQMAG
jgi:hypothetical protein